jgi:hypothetical protein
VDNILSFNEANTLMNKYGGDLKGIFGMTTVTTPAAAEAVTQAGKCGKIAVVGWATHNMKPYVNAGCVPSVVLRNPIDVCYAAGYAMRASIDGTHKPGDTTLKAGRLGDLKDQRLRDLAGRSKLIYEGEHKYLRFLTTHHRESHAGDRRPHGTDCGPTRLPTVTQQISKAYFSPGSGFSV